MKIIKNYFYNLVYQIITIIIPFILLPYLAKTIGVEANGIYSYTKTIADYFMLFAMLGLKNYGVRAIARVKDNKEKLSKTFSEIYLMQIISSITVIIVYVLCNILLFKNYTQIFWIQTIYLSSTILDITWFYTGIEEFKSITIKNSVIKILSLILIFGFVKTEKDLWIYTIITAISYLIGNLIFWYKINRYIIKYKINSVKDINKHFLPNLKLFISVIAVSLYKMMDKVMIEWISGPMQLGYYEYAEKINYMQILITTTIGTVMLPYMSALNQEKNESKYKSTIYTINKIVMFFAFGMSFGILMLSNEFVNIYLGSKYITTAQILAILAITGIPVTAANIIRTMYLLPKNKDNIYIKSVILGAITNISVNLLLINNLGGIGAAVGTVIAEITVWLYQTIKIRKEISLKIINKYIIIYLNASILMCISIYILKTQILNVNNEIINIFIQMLLGMIVYVLLVFIILKKELQKDFKQLIDNIKSKCKES